MLWVLILAAIFLLFGGKNCPNPKPVGQSKKAFKEGMSEADEAEEQEKKRKGVSASPLLVSRLTTKLFF